ncbi:MAG: hypothetical protein ABIH25_00085 [Candidatus Woesearchaeota archaeon]
MALEDNLKLYEVTITAYFPEISDRIDYRMYTPATNGEDIIKRIEKERRRILFLTRTRDDTIGTAEITQFAEVRIEGYEITLKKLNTQEKRYLK